ncbi:3-oxoacyl-[acyl-carrier-protein] synthase 3 (plasmid) [Actinosynnema sp. ALI-1.44]
MIPGRTTPSGAGTAAVLCGIGAATPSGVVTNQDLCDRLDTTDTWIRSRTGITTRHVAADGESTEDLAAAAATRALHRTDDTGTGATGGAGAVVVATTTPDRACPATAPALAARLGLGTVPAVDQAAGCTGFLYALATAAGWLATGVADSVLVIGVDRLATLPAPDDRTTVPLFGDAAGAVMLRCGHADEPGAIGPLVLGSDGTGRDLITAARPGELLMRGQEVFRHAVDRMTSASTAAAAAAGWPLHRIDRLVPHQANARITDFVANRLAIPHQRRLHNVETVGNTGAASIPLLLAHAAAAGDLVAGHRVLLTAFGAGLTWGATTLTWPDLT